MGNLIRGYQRALDGLLWRLAPRYKSLETELEQTKTKLRQTQEQVIRHQEEEHRYGREMYDARVNAQVQSKTVRELQEVLKTTARHTIRGLATQVAKNHNSFLIVKDGNIAYISENLHKYKKCFLGRPYSRVKEGTITDSIREEFPNTIYKVVILNKLSSHQKQTLEESQPIFARFGFRRKKLKLQPI